MSVNTTPLFYLQNDIMEEVQTSLGFLNNITNNIRVTFDLNYSHTGHFSFGDRNITLKEIAHKVNVYTESGIEAITKKFKVHTNFTHSKLKILDWHLQNLCFILCTIANKKLHPENEHSSLWFVSCMNGNSNPTKKLDQFIMFKVDKEINAKELQCGDIIKFPNESNFLFFGVYLSNGYFIMKLGNKGDVAIMSFEQIKKLFAITELKLQKVLF
jgi:hypothetical protein